MANQYDDPYEDDTNIDPLIEGPILDPETPTLGKVIADAIDARLLEVHTGMPCVVVKVRNNSYVDIQPLLMRKYIDAIAPVPLPVIQNVPVSHPRGNLYWIKLPIAVGDFGYAMFAERSLDTWMVFGSLADPVDNRTHDLNDAVFVPGLYPTSNPVEGDALDMVLHNGLSQIVVKPTGKFKIQNVGVEFIDLTIQLATQAKALAAQTSDLSNTLSTDTVNTIFGPMQLNSFAQYAIIKAQVDIIKAQIQVIISSMNTLKG